VHSGKQKVAHRGRTTFDIDRIIPVGIVSIPWQELDFTPVMRIF
jgi:hypothetical protein